MTTLRALLFILTLVAACGCATRTADTADSGAPGGQLAVAADVPQGNSLYALGAEWTTQQGDVVRLRDLQGRPVLMAMVYTNCMYACPIIVHDMKRIHKAMPAELAEDVRFVLVSLDPERDGPDALASFARAYGLDDGRWTLLQGDPGDVRMLAAVLGVKYRKEADGHYSHTNLVAALNPDGELLHREINPGGEPTSLLAALQGQTASTAL